MTYIHFHDRSSFKRGFISAHKCLKYLSHMQLWSGGVGMKVINSGNPSDAFSFLTPPAQPLHFSSKDKNILISGRRFASSLQPQHSHRLPILNLQETNSTVVINTLCSSLKPAIIRPVSQRTPQDTATVLEMVPRISLSHN